MICPNTQVDVSFYVMNKMKMCLCTHIDDLNTSTYFCIKWHAFELNMPILDVSYAKGLTLQRLGVCFQYVKICMTSQKMLKLNFIWDVVLDPHSTQITCIEN